jgi:two-component system, OmpR family, alkaline phosphatase synthesis response regulator PhoP
MAKKILVAEDDTALIKVLTDTLSNAGYDVVQARNGNEALEKIATEKPDMMLLDIIMPEKSGFDVLEELRVKRNSKMPVIIITNLGQKEDIELGKNLQVVDYVVKSDVSLKNIVLKIHQTLSA